MTSTGERYDAARVSGEALAAHPDPFVRHQVDPGKVLGLWTHGAATAVAAIGHLPAGTGTVVTLLGAPADLLPLADRLAATIEVPWRVSVEEDEESIDGTTAADALPEAWRHTERWRWHWMLSTAPPATEPGENGVVEVTSAAEIDTLLDEGAPTAHARPGSPGIECWLGLREAGALVAVGALVRQPGGVGHLRAVTVLPQARGRGLGRTLSAALTRRALAPSGVATLGVYTHNDVAVGIYRSLGYEVVHTFASGPTSGFSMTTAAAPSR